MMPDHEAWGEDIKRINSIPHLTEISDFIVGFLAIRMNRVDMQGVLMQLGCREKILGKSEWKFPSSFLCHYFWGQKGTAVTYAWCDGKNSANVTFCHKICLRISTFHWIMRVELRLWCRQMVPSTTSSAPDFNSFSRLFSFETKLSKIDILIVLTVTPLPVLS